MKLASSAHMITPATQTEVTAALASDDEVEIPPVTPVEHPVLQSQATTDALHEFIAQLNAGKYGNTPLLHLDQSTKKLLAKEVKGASPKSTHVMSQAEFSAQQRLALQVGGGAVAGGSIAALVQIATHSGSVSLRTLATVFSLGFLAGGGATVLIETTSGHTEVSGFGFKLKRVV